MLYQPSQFLNICVSEKHCKITKHYQEYISLVVKVSSSSYQILLKVLSEIELSQFEFLSFVTILVVSWSQFKFLRFVTIKFFKLYESLIF